MISITSWKCPEGLIARALSEHPIEGGRVALNKMTGNFFYDEWVIKDEFKNTAWHNILNSLPCAVGEARVITLQPSESYYAHADIDNRWHLNLQGEQSYLIDLNDKKMYQQQVDNCWQYMDAGKLHTASNYGSIPRIQLVVRELLRRPNQSIDLVTVTIEPAYEQYDYRYKFDNIFSPWLNRVNYNYQMFEFAPTDKSVTFKLEKKLIPELDKICTADFKITYQL
jgi:hypothetical protein